MFTFRAANVSMYRQESRKRTLSIFTGWRGTPHDVAVRAVQFWMHKIPQRLQPIPSSSQSAPAQGVELIRMRQVPRRFDPAPSDLFES